MGARAEKLFQKRFGEKIEVVYQTRSIDGEEKQLIQKRISDALKAVMTALLKREPTREELLGLVPIVVSKKKGRL